MSTVHTPQLGRLLSYILSAIVSASLVITGWTLLEVVHLKVDVAVLQTNRFTVEAGRKLELEMATLNSNDRLLLKSLERLNKDVSSLTKKFDDYVTHTRELTFNGD